MWRENNGLMALAPRDAKSGASDVARSDVHLRAEPATEAVRFQLVQLPKDATAFDACSALFALHADAIARNLQCVLTSVDPEGPHQLRVTLRRLRVMLKVFRPVLRRTEQRALARSARELGAIAGDLRDADVLVDTLIGPLLGDGPALAQLNDWRRDVRGRVRARLIAAKASAFAEVLTAAPAAALKSKAAKQSAVVVVRAFLADAWSQSAPRAEKIDDLSHEALHDLRKDAKALRYASELEGAFSGDRQPKAARALKRIQDHLGHVNDVLSLSRFTPPVGADVGLRALLDGLIREQQLGLDARVAEAGREWRRLARHWPWQPAITATL